MRRAGRALLRAVMVLLVAVAVGPVDSAMAEAPQLTIESPPNGKVINSPTPNFSGTTNDTFDEVKLKVYTGTTVKEEAPVETLRTSPVGTEWSVGSAEPLTPGTYTAQATQTNLITPPETGE